MNTSIRILLSVSIIISWHCTKQRIIPADIVIHNAEVYTMEMVGSCIRANRVN